MPLWIIVVGIVIYFFWAKKKQTQSNFKKEMSTSLNNEKTSLNPLFSEKEISDRKNLFTQWEKVFHGKWASLWKKEKEEIKNFNGKKENFIPSKYILSLLEQIVLAQFCVDAAKRDYEKMIEANIAVINGKEISVAEKEYYNSINKTSIPYQNLDIIYNSDIWVKETGDNYKNDLEARLKQRKNYWLTSWDSILKETN